MYKVSKVVNIDHKYEIQQNNSKGAGIIQHKFVATYCVVQYTGYVLSEKIKYSYSSNLNIIWEDLFFRVSEANNMIKPINRRIAITVIFILLTLSFLPFYSSISFAGYSNQLIKSTVTFIKNENYEKALSSLLEVSTEGDSGLQNNRILFLKGYSYFQLKQYDKAIAIFENDLSGKYSSIEDLIFYLQALSYSEKGDNEKSLSVLESLKKQYPSTIFRSKVDFLTIQKLISLENLKSAASLLKKFIKKYPYDKNRALAMSMLATLWKELNNPWEEYKSHTDIYINYPLGEFAKEAEERRKFIKKNYKIKLYKASPKERLKRVRTLMNGRKLNSAVSELKKLIAEKHGREITIKATFSLGRCYIFLRQHKRGIKILNKLAKKYKGHKIVPKAYYRMVKTYWNVGEVSNAISFCNTIIKSFPGSKWHESALYILGRINEDRGNRDKAIDYYSEIIKKFPRRDKSPEISWRIGWTYYINKDYKKAINSFTHTVKRFSGSEYVDVSLYWKGRAYEQIKNIDKAKKVFSYLAKQFPYTYYGNIGMQKATSLGVKNISEIADASIKFRNVDLDDLIGFYNKALSSPPVLTDNGKRLLKRVEELILLGFHEDAKKEVDRMAKSIDKKKTNSVLWLSALYFKSEGYVKYFRILNNFMDFFARKRRSKKLPSDFLRMYYPLGFWEAIVKHSEKNDVDPFLITGLIRQESVFDYNALSSAGARGLMQLITGTAKRELKSLKMDTDITHKDLFNPDLNIKLGTHHFKRLIKKFNGDIVLALISYNAGITKAKEWKKRFNGMERDMFVEKIPYPETRGYVKNVMRNHFNYKSLYSPL